MAAGPLWYQLYLAGGRAVVEAKLARVWKSGCRVLAVTIDTNTPGLRERDIRNGTAALMAQEFSTERRSCRSCLLARDGCSAFSTIVRT